MTYIMSALHRRRMLCCVTVVLAALTSSALGRLVEEERIVEYHKRNYTFPLQTYVPNHAGWRQLLEKRFTQVSEIENRGQRYEGYMQVMHSAHLVPNFTEYGFGLARCPDALLTDLQTTIREGLPKARLERRIEVIDAPQQPLFVQKPELTKRVLHEMLPYAEEWSHTPLTPATAYGFRLYQNQSRLNMHVDKLQTHIVSFILHIDSSEDAEPWPIFIEDFHGRTHEVVLTPGDMLLYESSKCLHGRPRRLNGSWYSSLFVHYFPRDGWEEIDHTLESHYAVPPSWSEVSNVKSGFPALELVGTSLTEPSCPNHWCGTENSVKWGGPGEKGFWITPSFQRIPFEPPGWNDEL